jgi:hypothetical protein
MGDVASSSASRACSLSKLADPQRDAEAPLQEPLNAGFHIASSACACCIDAA